MTRLKEPDISRIICQIEQYNQELLYKTGHTLAEIAARAVGLKGMDREQVQALGTVAVIPMTSGQGVIGGFSEAVAGILTFLGAKAFVTSGSDVKGIAEALERQAKISFMADDERFIAVSWQTGQCSDNSVATGKGYAAALDYMTGGVKERNVLILGAGPVGTAAAFAVLNFGGKVHVFDKNPDASQALAKAASARQDIHIERELDAAMKVHRVIVDACPEAAFITPEQLYSDSYVAAPGMPLGIQAEALTQIRNRLIHDPLQIGVATMLFDIISGIAK